MAEGKREQTPRPIPYGKTPDYPGFGEITGFAEDFRSGAERAYTKGATWARYYRDPYLDILVSKLQEGIFGIYTFPPAGYKVADTQDIELVERYRGWVLQYRADPYGWRILASSWELGEAEFDRVRDTYKAG
ncbi:hypothetical protein ES708_30068 [subsurface metagenome]